MEQQIKQLQNYIIPEHIYNRIESITNRSYYGIYIILISSISYIIHKYTSNSEITIFSPPLIQNVSHETKNTTINQKILINESLSYRDFLLMVKKVVSNSNKQGATCIIPRGIYCFLENIHGQNIVCNIKEKIIFDFKINKGKLYCSISHDFGDILDDILVVLYNDLIGFLETVTYNPDSQLSQINFITNCSRVKDKYNEFNLFCEIIERILGTVYEYKQDKSLSSDTNPKLSDVPNLVLLKKGSNRKQHIFFVHDGSGSVESYIGLASNIDTEINCWGIKACELISIIPRNDSIESITENYLNNMFKISSEGPFCIVGWSSGGKYAFEIARQIEVLGFGLVNLILIDARSPYQDPNNIKWSFNSETEIEFLNRIFSLYDMNIETKSNDLDTIYKELLIFLENHKEIDKEVILKMIPNEIKQVIPVYAMQNIKEILYYANIIRTIHRASFYYNPSGILKSQIHYIKPSRSDICDSEQWDKYCQNKMHICYIEGDHYSIFKEPYVKTLAFLINELVKKK